MLPPQSASAVLVDEEVATSVYETVSLAVVSIAIIRNAGGVPVREVIGSGVVWDNVGPHVVTNFHMLPPLQGTSTLLEVTLTDAATGAATTTGARVVGSDSLHDLAVLRLLPLAPSGAADQELEQQQQKGAPPQQEQEQEQQPGQKAELVLAGEGAAASNAGSDSLMERMGLPTVQPIRLGTSADLRVGQSVFALGRVVSRSGANTGATTAAGASSSNRASTKATAGTGTSIAKNVITSPSPSPGAGAGAGAGASMSAGLVSGLDRSIPSPVGARIYGVIQTDALVNAANSGGPLVDSAGRLVGLCTAVGAARAGAVRGSGVYFALPADLLRDVVPKTIVYGNPYGKK